jgi:superfamily II DNA or RNA helicase
MATGTGKTVVFAELARIVRHVGRTLVLAHREELVLQAQAKIQAVGLRAELEMADHHAGPNADAVVASVQTLARPGRLRAFPPDAFALVVVDEAHHAAADSYGSILAHFETAKVLGVTATPDRLDKAGLDLVFDTVALRYEIHDAIREGYLVPVRQQTVVVEGFDLSTVRTLAGDLSTHDLAEILAREEILQRIASPLAELAGDRPTLAFMPSVAGAYALAGVLRRYSAHRVETLDGESPAEQRHATLRAFERGEVGCLVNCSLFTEGFDAPRIACVALARPTKSRALYAQMIGRGTRLMPGKTDLLVIDFAGNAGRHMLVTPADVLGGGESPVVLDRARKLLAESQGADVLEVLDQARGEQAKAERAALTVKARYRAHDVDPFGVLGVTAPRSSYMAGGASEKQLAALDRFKIDFDPAKITRGEASALIATMVDRFKRGLCSYKQAKLLARYGYNGDVTRADATTLIDAIKAAGWRRPAEPASG